MDLDPLSKSHSNKSIPFYRSIIGLDNKLSNSKGCRKFYSNKNILKID